jgi:hypothetical protein
MNIYDPIGITSFGDSNIPYHPMAGNLMLGSNSRVISHRFTDTVQILQGDLPTYDIYILHTSITDNPIRGAFMAYYYSKFVLETGDENRQKEELASAALGLLLNSVDYVRIIRENNELTTFCTQSGFIPVFRELLDPEDISS